MVQELSSSTIAVLKEVGRQLSNLTQVVCSVQQDRRTLEESQHGDGCELGSDFLELY